MGNDDDGLAGASPRRSKREILVAAGAELLPSLVAAAIAGFLVAGIGGRLAMFLLRVTSGNEMVGIESDDGFIIGRFTTATIGLVLALTVAATVAVGPTYAVARLWIPQTWRIIVFALFFGILGGGLLVHSDGIDFRLLSPQILAVGLFVAIPLVFGASLEPIHRLVRPHLRRVSAWLLLLVPIAASAPLLFTGTPGIAIVVIGLGVVSLQQGDRLGELVTSRPVAWLGRLGMTAIAGLAGLDLARDIEALF